MLTDCEVKTTYMWGIIIHMTTRYFYYVLKPLQYSTHNSKALAITGLWAAFKIGGWFVTTEIPQPNGLSSSSFSL